MITATTDVTVITTIHPPFEPRIYARCYLPLRAAGFRTAMVSTWVQPEDDGEERWITVPPARGRIQRVLLAARVFRAALSVRSRVYYFHDIDFLPWACALRILTRAAVVYDCHENYPHEIRHNKEWIPGPFRGPLATATRLVEDSLVRFLGHVVVPVRALIPRFERLRARVTLVRNVADVFANPGLQHDDAVLHSGSLTPSFGSDVLLGIARESRRRGRNYRFVLSTRNATPATLHEYREAIGSESLSIDLVPPVGSHEMHTLLAKGRIGLSIYRDTPEKRLAVPTKLFEYMAAGMPIVASDLPLIREIVDESGAGILVPAEDPSAFLDAIDRLHDDPAAFDRFRSAGLAAVEDLYSWKNEREGLFAAVRAALGGERVSA